MLTPSEKHPAPTSMLARQPIYRTDLSVYGYELLFRNSQPTTPSEFDGNLATTSVVLTAFVDIGLEALVGEHRAFVNFPRDFLIGLRPIPEASKQLVIEVLEDITIDDELIHGLTQLKDQGYTLALDDVVYSEMLLPIMHLIDIVKVEYPAIPTNQLHDHVARFREWPVELLAEKIETREEFEECRDAGFDYFQGYFLSRPEVVRSGVADRQSPLLPLLNKLHSSCDSFDELEVLVRNDADLSFRMMRYLRSSVVGLNREVESLRHGLVLIGFGGVRRLITLMALKSMQGTPSESLVSSLVRASMCQAVAASVAPNLVDAAYTTGLFSELDAILGRPIEEILESLPLSAEIRDAILSQEGMLGRILTNTIAYETADWQKIDLTLCSEEAMRDAYVQAIQAADNLMKEVEHAVI